MNSIFRFEDSYFDSRGFLYFFAYDFNGLFRIDFHNQRTEFMISVKEYKRDQERLFGSVICVDDMLYFSPLSANDVLVYCINSNSYSLIPIENRKDYVGNRAKFYAICTCGEDIFMFPAHYPAVIQIGTKNKDVRYYDCLNKIQHNIAKGYFRQSVCCRDNKIIAPFCHEDIIMIFDTERGVFNTIELNTQRNDNRGFSGICYDGEYYWLTSITGSELFKWNYEKNLVKRIELGNNNLTGRYSYVGCISWNNMIIVKPAYNNDLCLVDAKTNEVFKHSSEEYGFDCKSDVIPLSTITSLCELNDNKLMMCQGKGDYYILDYSNKSLSITNYSPTIEDAFLEWTKVAGEFNSYSFEEDDLFGIKALINLIFAMDE